MAEDNSAAEKIMPDVSTAGEAGSGHTLHYELFEYSPFMTVLVDRQGRIIEYNAAKKNSGDRQPVIGEVMYRDYAARHSFDMHAELINCIESSSTRTYANMTYGERVLSITIAPFTWGAMIVTQDVTQARRAEKEMVALIEELNRALGEIETLRELLPICASCKRIRDDSGYWSVVEEYLGKRANLNFSHTLCPECVRKLYPGIVLPGKST